MGISMFEDKHHLAGSKSEAGQRRIVAYHAVWPSWYQPIKEIKSEVIIGYIYQLKKLEAPES
jgi:hypothetical protein